jgi:hypothetical protein
MRSSLLLLLMYSILGILLWSTLSGAWLILSLAAGFAVVIISEGYRDTFLLFLLGARQVRESDQRYFFEAAYQESYKLALPPPRLYFYNGTLERAFVFHTRRGTSIILNKSLLEKASLDELHAICFELMLQVKKGLATKRTRSTFLLGSIIWISRSFTGLMVNFIPFNEVRRSCDWFFNCLFSPFLEFLFNFMMGEKYFKKLEHHLNEYPSEKELLMKVGLKLRRPYFYYSLPSRKLLELQATSKNRSFQNIMALEFLPHEWDFLFKDGE